MSESKSLKALKQEAKSVGVKGYTKLSRDDLIQKIADMSEQNAIASALNLTTLITENKTVPEPVASVLTPEEPEPPVPPVVEENFNPNELLPPVVPETKEEPKTPTKKRTAPKKQKAPKKERKQSGPNKWQQHIKAYREANPSISYKQAMVDAKASYKA